MKIGLAAVHMWHVALRSIVILVVVECPTASALSDSFLRASTLAKNRSATPHSTNTSGQRIDLPDRSSRDLYLLAGLLGKAPHGDLDLWTQRLEANLQQKGMVVTEGNSGQNRVARQANRYNSLARSPGLTTVCETGFNAGHSALRFLVLSDAHVYEFDLGMHDYSHESAVFLQRSFPGRLTVTWGDSTVSLPNFSQANPSVKCDIIIVDGGHDFHVAMADLRNFMRMASTSHTLVIDDTPCNALHCQGPTEAWSQLKRSGCIAETESVLMRADRGFSIGRYVPNMC